MANKQARVLVARTIDGVAYKPNQLIDADAALIKQLVKDGIACDDAKSVEYCIGEGEKPIAHKSSDAEKLTKAQAKAAAKAKAESIATLQAEIDHLNAELNAAADAGGDTAPIAKQIEAKQAELAALQA